MSTETIVWVVVPTTLFILIAVGGFVAQYKFGYRFYPVYGVYGSAPNGHPHGSHGLQPNIMHPGQPATGMAHSVAGLSSAHMSSSV